MFAYSCILFTVTLLIVIAYAQIRGPRCVLISYGNNTFARENGFQRFARVFNFENGQYRATAIVPQVCGGKDGVNRLGYIVRACDFNGVAMELKLNHNQKVVYVLRHGKNLTVPAYVTVQANCQKEFPYNEEKWF